MMKRRTALPRRYRSVCALITAALTFGAVGVRSLAAQSDTQPPAISSQSPGSGATNVVPSVNITAAFTEPVQSGSISFVLRTSTNTVVPAAVTYDAARRTAILNPTQDLLASGTYTATVTGVTDLAGNVQATAAVWSFTVASLSFQDSIALSGLTRPTVMQFAPDGRVFVAEKSGLIQVFDDLSDTTPTLFADLRTNVHDFGERGLLGMALDPTFPTRPYVYVLYTHDAPIGGTAPRWGTPGVSLDPCPNASTTGCEVSARLSRLQANGSQMTGPEQVLVENWFQQFPGQSIGSLAFGPDGALYASAGDGASPTLIDYGQLGSSSVDPPQEGGALRSQDLRTPADAVTLDGTIVRVHPDTGQPLRQTTSMTVGAPTTDANGVKSYSVTSVFQGSDSTIVRVLEPTNPAPGKPRRILYVLPVESGVTSLGSFYSDGLEELRLLNAHNRFNVTLIAPSFHIEPWYGDHATDPDRRLESFIVNDLVPFGDTFAPPGTIAQRWLIGFSKSGNGALTALLRHPHVFSAAAAWDAPAQFTDMSAFAGMGQNFGTEENFDLYEIPGLVSRNAEAFRQRYRVWISGDDSAWTSHMVELDDQMDEAGIVHSFVEGGSRVHSWYSGWLDASVTALDANVGATAPTDANAQRLIAYGLRRPARFTFRPGTSEIWVGDNGGSDSEEINRITNSTDGIVENFGWPCYEGTATTGYTGMGLSICDQLADMPAAVTTPVFSYRHAQPIFPGSACAVGDASVSGLTFYGSGGYPAIYDGALFLADRLRSCIWVMFKGANGQPDPAAPGSVLASAASPSDLKIGPGGDVFYADHDGGTVRRLFFASGNRTPTAVIQATPTSGPSPLTVGFSAAASSDPDNDALGFAWDLDGDGEFDDSTAAQPNATYEDSENHVVRLRVTDGHGLSDVASVVISSGNTAPVVTIAAPSAATAWSVGEVLPFSGSASDAEDGTLQASAMRWSVILHDCSSTCQSSVVQTFPGVASGAFVAPDTRYPSHLELQLTATDSRGIDRTTSVLIQPRTVVLTFASNPAGLQLAVGSVSSTAPFTRTAIVNSSNVISAPTPQGEYLFTSWSDGGAQSHSVIAGSAPATYTATYTRPLSPNLVLALSFDQGSGSTAVDASGKSNNGTISGATWTTQGKFGSALSFDGVNDWVTVADANTLDLTTGLTLEAWVFPTAIGSGSWRNVIIKERSGGEVYNLYANADTNAPIVYVIRASQPGSPVDAGGSSQLPLNGWSHLAVTYDGSDPAVVREREPGWQPLDERSGAHVDWRPPHRGQQHLGRILPGPHRRDPRLQPRAHLARDPDRHERSRGHARGRHDSSGAVERGAFRDAGGGNDSDDAQPHDERERDVPVWLDAGRGVRQSAGRIHDNRCDDPQCAADRAGQRHELHALRAVPGSRDEREPGRLRHLVQRGESAAS